MRKKKLIIGIIAGAAAIGGIVAIAIKNNRKRSCDRLDALDCDDEELWDDDEMDDVIYECNDPELRDSQRIIDAAKELADVVGGILDRKKEELYG
ncbi:MAG: hypothetical protein E7294_05340 [Lachnospiraceae bacterium]|nr:hypothetical protein [Lachnospiraceae bacterium]